jgi:ABC-2 type transport system permease protein
LLPLIGILFSLVIYNGDESGPVPIGLIDKDHSTLSSDFASTLKASGSYNVAVIGEEEITNRLLSQTLEAVVIIPEGYEESIIEAGNPVKMQLLSLKGQETTIWLEQLINLHTRNLTDLSQPRQGIKLPSPVVCRIYKNPLR